jgi:hypothetical protein
MVMAMVGAYLAERFRPRTFMPLAVAIAMAASGGALSGARLGVDVAFALLLLAQFRSWDDLADRDRDARTHPERVLVRATSVAPIVAFSGALAALSICVAARRDASGVAAAVLLALIGVLSAWYSLRTVSTVRTAAGDHLLLSKYAAMVIIVAGARALTAPVQILGAALALHLVVCVYEVWHDPVGPLSVRLSTWLSIGGHR